MRSSKRKHKRHRFHKMSRGTSTIVILAVLLLSTMLISFFFFRPTTEIETDPLKSVLLDDPLPDVPKDEALPQKLLRHTKDQTTPKTNSIPKVPIPSEATYKTLKYPKLTSTPPETKTLPTTTIPSIQPTPSIPISLPSTPSPQLDKGTLGLQSEGCPVTADVKGNLAAPSVITSNIKKDWLKHRWQAAADMSGRPISGSHWVEIDLMQSVTVTKIVIDYEQAYCNNYEINCKKDIDSKWERIFTNHRKRMSSGKHLIETRNGKGTNTHVIHDIDLNYPTYAYDCQYIQLFMKKPASNWGVSIWEIEIFGYGKGADICKNYVPGTNNRKSKDTNDKPIATQSSATFLSSPKFHGEKPGYIFRPGGSGQGYYKVGFDDHYSPDEHEHHHH